MIFRSIVELSEVSLFKLRLFCEYVCCCVSKHHSRKTNTYFVKFLLLTFRASLRSQPTRKSSRVISRSPDTTAGPSTKPSCAEATTKSSSLRTTLSLPKIFSNTLKPRCRSWGPIRRSGACRLGTTTASEAWSTRRNPSCCTGPTSLEASAGCWLRNCGPMNSLRNGEIRVC